MNYMDFFSLLLETDQCSIQMDLDQYAHQLCFLHGIADDACRISWSVRYWIPFGLSQSSGMRVCRVSLNHD